MYDIRINHFRDIYGKLLWVDPVQEEHRLFIAGEEFILDAVKYKVERIAVAENTQHINVSIVKEDENIVEPYL